VKIIINERVDEVIDLWKKYNEYSKKLADVLGRTNNIVGEYAEYLAQKYTGGDLLDPANVSADIRATNGTLYQVKSRRVNGSSTQLNVISSWNFDFLFVILFDQYGAVEKALLSPVSVAKEYGKKNNHQNGWVITTTHKFLHDPRNKDITSHVKKLETASPSVEAYR
jgi:hypothetical protein